jgi:hypothetical protein
VSWSSPLPPGSLTPSPHVHLLCLLIITLPSELNTLEDSPIISSRPPPPPLVCASHCSVLTPLPAPPAMPVSHLPTLGKLPGFSLQWSRLVLHINRRGSLPWGDFPSAALITPLSGLCALVMLEFLWPWF